MRVCVCRVWACSWACLVMREDSASATEPQTCLLRWRYMGWPDMWTLLDTHREAHTHTHECVHATSVNSYRHTQKNTRKHPRDTKGRANEDIYLGLARGYTTHHRQKQTCQPPSISPRMFLAVCFYANWLKSVGKLAMTSLHCKTLWLNLWKNVIKRWWKPINYSNK